ncbi:MAG: hypothetical protein H6701_06650 [Myxococcales bacterium]|nr:hypothetical protein [Myxococcales bacterium]
MSSDQIELIPAQRLERLDGVTDGELVTIPNGSEARWARDTTGRLWVRKRESDTGFQPLLAEAMSHLLGRLLGVRQPMAAVYHDGTEWSWMSRAIRGALEHWSPSMRDRIANLDEVARMLVLDVLTLNEDRHQQNILVEAVEDEAHLRLWAIDSGNALIGYVDDYAERVDAPPDPRNHARGLPVRALVDHVRAAADEATHLDPHELEVIVAESCALVGEGTAHHLLESLTRRCRRASILATAYLDRLGGLS